MRREDRLALLGLLCGLFAAVAAMALPYAYPNLPILLWRILFWSGLTLASYCFLFLIYDLFIRERLKKEVKMIPLSMIIIGILLIAGGTIYHLSDKKIYQKPEVEVSAKGTISTMGIDIGQKGILTLDLLINNEGPKEYAIENISVIIPTKDILLNLNDNDTLNNNFNNKPIMSYVRDHMRAYISFVNDPIFPIIIKVGELRRVKINVPFNVINYYKDMKIDYINKLIIGVRAIVLNYIGKSNEVVIYPFAELRVSKENQIIFSQSQTLATTFKLP